MRNAYRDIDNTGEHEVTEPTPEIVINRRQTSSFRRIESDLPTTITNFIL